MVTKEKNGIYRYVFFYVCVLLLLMLLYGISVFLNKNRTIIT